MTGYRNDFEGDEWEQLGDAVRVGKPPSSAWTSARPEHDRAEIVPADHWTGRAELQRMAGDIVRADDAPAATGDAWRPMPTVKEIGTPVHRATATLIRAAPLIVLLFPATLALIWMLEVSAWWILPTWAGLGIAAYLAVVLMDLQHNSPSSTERHRINKAAQVETLKLRQAHELRRAIVEAWLKHMEGK